MVDEYLRVKSVADIWAAGDIVDCQPSQFIWARSSCLRPLLREMIANSSVIIEKQSAALAKNLDLVLQGKDPVIYKSDASRKLETD